MRPGPQDRHARLQLDSLPWRAGDKPGHSLGPFQRDVSDTIVGQPCPNHPAPERSLGLVDCLNRKPHSGGIDLPKHFPGGTVHPAVILSREPREPGECSGCSGHGTLECWDKVRPDRIAPVPRVFIRWIFNRDEVRPTKTSIGLEFALPEPEQRPQDDECEDIGGSWTPPWDRQAGKVGHSGGPMQTTPPRQVQQHGLSLVVGVVSGHEGSIRSQTVLGGDPVPLPSCPLFFSGAQVCGDRSVGNANDSHRNIERVGVRGGQQGISGRSRPESMIDMQRLNGPAENRRQGRNSDEQC